MAKSRFLLESTPSSTAIEQRQSDAFRTWNKLTHSPQRRTGLMLAHTALAHSHCDDGNQAEGEPWYARGSLVSVLRSDIRHRRGLSQGQEQEGSAPNMGQLAYPVEARTCSWEGSKGPFRALLEQRGSSVSSEGSAVFCHLADLAEDEDEWWVNYDVSDDSSDAASDVSDDDDAELGDMEADDVRRSGTDWGTEFEMSGCSSWDELVGNGGSTDPRGRGAEEQLTEVPYNGVAERKSSGAAAGNYPALSMLVHNLQVSEDDLITRPGYNLVDLSAGRGHHARHATGDFDVSLPLAAAGQGHLPLLRAYALGCGDVIGACDRVHDVSSDDAWEELALHDEHDKERGGGGVVVASEQGCGRVEAEAGGLRQSSFKELQSFLLGASLMATLEIEPDGSAGQKSPGGEVLEHGPGPELDLHQKTASERCKPEGVIETKLCNQLDSSFGNAGDSSEMTGEEVYDGGKDARLVGLEGSGEQGCGRATAWGTLAERGSASNMLRFLSTDSSQSAQGLNKLSDTASVEKGTEIFHKNWSSRLEGTHSALEEPTRKALVNDGGSLCDTDRKWFLRNECSDSIKSCPASVSADDQELLLPALGRHSSEELYLEAITDASPTASDTTVLHETSRHSFKNLHEALQECGLLANGLWDRALVV